MDIHDRIDRLVELLEKYNHTSETTFLKTIHLKDGKRAHLILMLRIDTEDEHREYIEYKREIMAGDERSAEKGGK